MNTYCWLNWQNNKNHLPNKPSFLTSAGLGHIMTVGERIMVFVSMNQPGLDVFIVECAISSVSENQHATEVSQKLSSYQMSIWCGLWYMSRKLKPKGIYSIKASKKIFSLARKSFWEELSGQTGWHEIQEWHKWRYFRITVNNKSSNSR